MHLKEWSAFRKSAPRGAPKAGNYVILLEEKMEKTTRRNFIKNVLLAGGTAANISLGLKSKSMKRPNILFILADDLGWCDLSAEGSDFYESRNLDRICAEGIRFTNGYATCQVCSPSRASILTGKYTPRHGITDWIGAPTGEAWRKSGRFSKMLPPDYERGLRAGEITFAEVLRHSGYRTFFAGKWHLGSEGAYPENFGFEINKGGWSVGSPRGGYFAPWENPKLEPRW